MVRNRLAAGRTGRKDGRTRSEEGTPFEEPERRSSPGVEHGAQGGTRCSSEIRVAVGAHTAALPVA
jgi:hypothetical protein